MSSDNRMKKQASSLPEYIETHYGGNKAAFARSQGVKPPQVTQWINKGFVVLDNELYSPRRKLISCKLRHGEEYVQPTQHNEN